MKSQHAFALAVALLWTSAKAQEWTTHSGDPQRTAWQRKDARLTKQRMKEFKLLWKLKLDNHARGLHSLTVPLFTNAGYRDLLIVGGTSDTMYALDADLGRVLWKRKFEYTSDVPFDRNATGLCPGGLLATPVISGPIPAKTPARASRRIIYAVSSDGNLRQLSLTDGEEISPPLKFTPPNGKPYSLALVDNVIYSTTGQRCGANPKAAIYSIDLNSPDKKVRTFPTTGGIWGLAGPAIGTDGTLYGETGDGNADPEQYMFGTSILALHPKDLKLKDYYTPTNAEWLTKRDLDLNATPVVFPYKGHDMIAASTGKEGRLLLLDSQSLGGEDHRTPLFRSDIIANYDVSFDAKGIWGSLASWEDATSTRWILAPLWGPVHPDYKFPVTNGSNEAGSIAAFKVEEINGKPVITPAWVSRELTAPAPPVVVNGMVFALSSGEDVRQTGSTVISRSQNSKHATLYAFDAETGKELFSSGDTIASFTHFGSLSVAGGRVFLTTWDNTVYAFGIYMEQ